MQLSSLMQSDVFYKSLDSGLYCKESVTVLIVFTISHFRDPTQPIVIKLNFLPKCQKIQRNLEEIIEIIRESR